MDTKERGDEGEDGCWSLAFLPLSPVSRPSPPPLCPYQNLWNQTCAQVHKSILSQYWKRPSEIGLSVWEWCYLSSQKTSISCPFGGHFVGQNCKEGRFSDWRSTIMLKLMVRFDLRNKNIFYHTWNVNILPSASYIGKVTIKGHS